MTIRRFDDKFFYDIFTNAMKEINYVPQGICARHIHVVIDDDNKISQLDIQGGCDGNHKGIISLCIGMDASDAASKLEGIKCGFKNTSCPDQIAKAIRKA